MPKQKSKFLLRDEAQTLALGQLLSSVLSQGDIVCLTGDLGAGKTTLSRGIICSLAGLQEVPSPTYTLVQTYGAPEFEIYHFDLYRVKHPAEIWELGAEDAFEDGLCLIEWPERLGPLRPDNTLDIHIGFHNQDEREIIISYPDYWPCENVLAALE